MAGQISAMTNRIPSSSSRAPNGAGIRASFRAGNRPSIRASFRASIAPSVRAAGRALFPAVVLATLSLPLGAQTDFHNLDKHRPLRVEDAYATKQRAFELQASPLALHRETTGPLRYTPAFELKYGFLPGMEGSIGIGLDVARDEGETRTELGEVDVSGLVNLWVEGSSLPAAAVRVTGHLATASGESSTLEARAILTRSLVGAVRAHLTAAAIVGHARAEEGWVGLAIDRTLPFQHALLLAETWISFPTAGTRVVHSSAGVRYQLSPSIVLDAGAGRGWTGDARQSWSLTFGVTHEFGIRSLIPGGI